MKVQCQTIHLNYLVEHHGIFGLQRVVGDAAKFAVGRHCNSELDNDFELYMGNDFATYKYDSS